MRYIRADEILPSELLEAIQQYVDGQLIYIPAKRNRNGEAGQPPESTIASATGKSFWSGNPA